MATRFVAPLFNSGNGISPSDGSTLDFFDTGTSTRKNTFADTLEATTNANPVVSDGDGLFPDIFITGNYKVVLKDKNGVQIFEADPVQSTSDDIISVGDNGAVCDGVADDTAAINTGEASTTNMFLVPQGTCSTTLANFNSLDKKYFGFDGQIDTVAGKIAPYYSHWDARPDPVDQTKQGTMLTAFDGDLSGSIFHVGQSIQNDTLGTPTTGFLFTTESALESHYTNISSGAGHNNATGDNTGRTGYVQNQGNIIHAGDGDAIVNHAKVTVSGDKVGATHFLAQPAGVLYGGAVFGGADNVNLTMGEIGLEDQGKQCRGAGFVFNYTRDKDPTASPTAAARNMFWSGARYNANGTFPCDAMLQAVGLWDIALDCTTGTMTAGKAAIALSQDQKIDFHAVVSTDVAGVKKFAGTFNQWDMFYNGTHLAIRAAGSNRILMDATSTTIANEALFVESVDGIDLSNAAGVLKVNTTQVVTAQQALVADASGGGTVDTEARAAINALLARLRTHGLIAT